MAQPKQFENAGKTPGLQVWRVEKMDLKLVPPELHGEFFSGDSYIILHTSPTLSRNIHAWIGKGTSVDERGAAAIFMSQLDNFFNGSPRQFTEFQNEESTTFMSYFKAGVRYKKGGIASGFQTVKPSDIQRVLMLKGRQNIRAEEVDMSWDSFNSGDCFLIDLGTDIYHWSGSKCNFFEAFKATEVAIEIRNNERSGRCTIHRIEEGSEPEAVIKLLGPKPDLPAKGADDDAAVDKKNRNIASLYLISDAAGSMKTELVAKENPFKQDMLSNKDCYILDNSGDHKIFVWKGKNANADERKAALAAANKFIKGKYPTNTQIQIMPDGGETALFKQFFVNWVDKYETTGPCQTYSMGRLWGEIPYDPSTVHQNKDMAAQHGMVDNGSGKVQIWSVEGGNKVPLDQSTYGQFFGGDCYLLLYTYSTGGKEKHIIYTWKGKCSPGEFPASPLINDSIDGVATQVRVSHGQEPAHLVSLFKKPLVIHLSGTSHKSGVNKPASTRLFHILQSSTKATRAVEVEPTASSLNSNDVFVLKSSKSLFIWRGKGGTPEQEEAAKYVASLLGETATCVAETKEPDDFWTELGGKKEYQTSMTRLKTVKPPRLFSCSNKTGSLITEEVPGNFTQLDLASDDVMILDTWYQIFLWIGRDANEIEKTGSLKIAQEYIDTDPSGRRSIPINIIKQREEPVSFTGWFQNWDEKMWDKDINQRINDLIKK